MCEMSPQVKPIVMIQLVSKKAHQVQQHVEIACHKTFHIVHTEATVSSSGVNSFNIQYLPP